MSLAGSAAVVIWNDVTVESRADFLEWHNREHIPERVSIPGFRRARRGCGAVTGPEFLTLYEVADAAVLTSGHYLNRLNSPSAWTQRILPQFRNTARSLCRVEVSVGGGVGRYLCSVRLPDELTQDPEALGRFRAFTCDLIPKSRGMLGAHLLTLDARASRQEIAENRLRAESVDMPATILLVEGTAPDVSAVARELADELERLALISRSDAVTGVYRHELCLVTSDRDAPASPDFGAL